MPDKKIKKCAFRQTEVVACQRLTATLRNFCATNCPATCTERVRRKRAAQNHPLRLAAEKPPKMIVDKVQWTKRRWIWSEITSAFVQRKLFFAKPYAVRLVGSNRSAGRRLPIIGNVVASDAASFHSGVCG